MRRSALARAVLVLAALTLVVVLAAWKRDDDRCAHAAGTVYLLGRAPAERIRPALQDLRDSCRGSERLALAALGLAKAGRGRLAVSAAREATRREPDSYGAWAAVTFALARDRPAAAAAARRRAAALNPLAVR